MTTENTSWYTIVCPNCLNMWNSAEGFLRGNETIKLTGQVQKYGQVSFMCPVRECPKCRKPKCPVCSHTDEG